MIVETAYYPYILKFGVLGYASEELRADKEVVLAALKQSDKAFRYVSGELKTDKEIVLAALNHKHYWLLRYTTEELLEAIKRNGNSLEPLSDWIMYGSTMN